MKGIKYLGLFIAALALSPLEAANHVGVNVGFPLSVKGEQHSGFVVGGVMSTSIMPKLVLDAGLDFMNLQFSESTQTYVGYSVVGRYSVYTLSEVSSVDAFLGLAGNGFSGLGVVVGGGARYALMGGAEARARLSFNTNQDVLMSVQLVKEFKLPHFGGKPYAEPVASEVAPVIVAPVDTPIPAEPAKMLAVKEAPKIVSSEGALNVKSAAQPISIELVGYKDIAGHWAKPDIEWAAANGIFSPADKFVPNAPINKFSADAVVKKVASFLHAPDAAAGVSFGVAVTKKDFVTGILRTIAVSKGTASPSDLDIARLSKSLKVPESWLVTSDKPLSRAEAAVVVSRLLQALTK